MIFRVILFFCLFVSTKCEEQIKKSKILLPSHKKYTEDIEDTAIRSQLRKTENDDYRSDIVAVLIKNIKTIFSDESEHKSTDLDDTKHAIYIRSTVKSFHEDHFSTRSTITTDVALFQNLSLAALLDTKRGGQNAHTAHLDINNGRHELLHLTKDLMYHEAPCGKEDDVSFAASGNSGFNVSRLGSDVPETRRSCIFCDNVMVEDCYDPKNKLIPSVVCEREEDLCYSQHTPFGIIDRGCFNVNHNLTTYVCSCNLCNYISISEMPYIFSNKRDWVDNVVELSRTRHFRKSVFKDMTCLRCEVNVTTKRSDMLDSANCLEGNIGTLPIQKCLEDEICAVKAIKNTGYIWRGCVKSPLYNYWWALCDTDLCNYDSLVSIYDYL